MPYPDDIDTYRAIENLPGLVYDANDKRTLFMEDLTQLRDSIIAVETILGVLPSSGYLTVKAWITEISNDLDDLILSLPDFPVGLIVGTTDVQTLADKRIVRRTIELTDGATITSNADDFDVAKVTLGGNRTLANPTGTPTDGQLIAYRIRQDVTGGRTLAYGVDFRFPAGTAPVLTTVAGKSDYLLFMYNSTDLTFDMVGIQQNL